MARKSMTTVRRTIVLADAVGLSIDDAIVDYDAARPGGPKPSSGSGTTPIAPSGRCLSSRTWLPLQVQAEPVRAQAPLRRGNTRRAASGRPRD